jgi:hypothetical protein
LANRGYLLNTTTPTADPSELERLRTQPGHIDAIVAGSSNRLLIPWFLCFRREDLKPSQSRGLALQMPSTTVERAVRNLDASRSVFEAIAGHPEVGRQWWAFACALTRHLPLPHLLLEIDEILDMGDESDAASIAQQIEGALAGDLSAVPHLKALAEWNEGARPFPIDVLYSAPSGPDKRRSPRTWNTTVLDCGFASFGHIRWNKAEGTPAPEVREPPEETYGELRNVDDLLKRWVGEEGVTDPAASLGVILNGTDQLFGEIFAESDEEALRLKTSPTLASKLDVVTRRRLEPWCEKNAFAWGGFRFSAPAWKRKVTR